MSSTDEEWRFIPGWGDRYQVSSAGRIRALEYRDRIGRLHKSMIRKIGLGTSGYATIVLNFDGVSGTFMVHRLVGEAFIGPLPKGLVTCHENGNKLDNRVENLRYDTYKENSLDILRMGRHPSQKTNLCPRGHTREGANASPSGGKSHVKSCRACNVAISHVRKYPEDNIQEIADARYEEIMTTGGLRGTRVTPEKEQQIRNLMSDSVSINEIIRTLGCSYYTIKRLDPEYHPFPVGGAGAASAIRKANETLRRMDNFGRVRRSD